MSKFEILPCLIVVTFVMAINFDVGKAQTGPDDLFDQCGYEKDDFKCLVLDLQAYAAIAASAGVALLVFAILAIIFWMIKEVNVKA